MSRQYIDLTGRRYGRLTVIDFSRRGNNKVYWNCECDCGNTKEVSSSHLGSGTTKSCGCLKRETSRKTRTNHGLSKGTDGKVTRLFQIWGAMKKRCTNPNDKSYKNYGARGITFHEDWSEYINFHNWAMANGYENGLSIERVDNDGDYEPVNCKWIELADQARNRRSSVFVDYKGERMLAMDLDKRMNFPEGTIKRRMDLGWSLEKSVNEPLGKGRNIKKCHSNYTN